MWNYLKSDLQELVSVVKEDTNVVLEKIQDEQNEKKATAASREAERRMAMEETFVVPLIATEEDEETPPEEVAAIEQFRKEFDVESKTDEISELLEEYSDSLRVLFEELVPQVVTYEDFWERFFFRCDEARIQAEWDEEDERATKARAELIGSVSSFLGGAAKAVASGVATVTTAASNDTGRPPFVMNTAVSEDEEDEEEELGWGDDDEDDEEISVDEVPNALEESADTENTEQIEFNDEALESSRAELKQALDERDQLQQTVELLKGEIATLRTDTAVSNEIESLRKALSQKEKELEASKTMQNSNQDAIDSSQAAKIAELSRDVLLKNDKIDELEKLCAATDQASKEQIQSIESENVSLKEQLAKASAEVSKLQEKQTASLASSQNRIASLTAELKATKAQAKADTELMRLELEKLRASNEKESDATPESAESGVKLSKPPVAKLASGDEEDDWGDDWD